MKTLQVLFKSVALAALQLLVFVILYDSGFNLDIWLTNSTAHMGIGYGLTIQFGVWLMPFLGFINAGVALRVKEVKFKIICALSCFILFGWCLSGLAGERPYKFLIILLSSFIAFFVPLVAITLATNYSES
jgi:hypothetical protein